MMRVTKLTMTSLAACFVLTGCQSRDNTGDKAQASGTAGENGTSSPGNRSVAEPTPVAADGNDDGLCKMTTVPEGSGSAGLRLEGRVGKISLYAEPGGLICSEASANGGDCQVVQGRRVTVAQLGREDVKVEALTPAPYMLYGQPGPIGVRCTADPAAVPRAENDARPR